MDVRRRAFLSTGELAAGENENTTMIQNKQSTHTGRCAFKENQKSCWWMFESCMHNEKREKEVIMIFYEGHEVGCARLLTHQGEDLPMM